MYIYANPDLHHNHVKHLFPDPAVFPRCNAAMGGDKLIITKHWHVMYINTVPIVGEKTCFH